MGAEPVDEPGVGLTRFGDGGSDGNELISPVSPLDGLAPPMGVEPPIVEPPRMEPPIEDPPAAPSYPPPSEPLPAKSSGGV
jgi:hypothetical protein